MEELTGTVVVASRVESVDKTETRHEIVVAGLVVLSAAVRPLPVTSRRVTDEVDRAVAVRIGHVGVDVTRHRRMARVNHLRQTVHRRQQHGHQRHFFT